MFFGSTAGSKSKCFWIPNASTICLILSDRKSIKIKVSPSRGKHKSTTFFMGRSYCIKFIEPSVDRFINLTFNNQLINLSVINKWYKKDLFETHHLWVGFFHKLNKQRLRYPKDSKTKFWNRFPWHRKKPVGRK